MSRSLDIARDFLGKKVEVTIDRPLGSLHPKHGFNYEANYGFIQDVLAPDGEFLDAYYLNVNTALEGKVPGACIAVIHRLDDDDDKLAVVPLGTSLSDEEILKQTYFQEQWFEVEVIRH